MTRGLCGVLAAAGTLLLAGSPALAVEQTVVPSATTSATATGSWDTTAWAAWQVAGGQVTAPRAVVSWGPGRVDLFARGTDGGLWQRSYDVGRWNSWAALGS